MKLLLAILLLPSAAAAQSALSGGIAGLVRDASGAVLPGVTVEAASPALIEKVRAVVSDDQGQYKILDLRPGTYTVTFTLAGFATFRREGIELTTGFTATINADLRVGALEETITVSGQSPIVDTQNTRQTVVMTRQVLDTIPVTKTQQGFGAITLGASTALARQDVGGSSGEQTTGITQHGIGDSVIHVDGATIMAINGTGTARYFRPNEVSAEEISISNGSATGESQTGGAITNYVPRDGGNTYKATFTGAYTNNSFQATNLDDDLISRGLKQGPAIDKIWDAGMSVGGPIQRDKVWYHVAYRNWGQWLELRLVRAQRPDAAVFPEFTENLRDAMHQETELFLASQLREDRSILDLMTADYSFLNETLAQHYGVPDVYGVHLRRVRVDDPRRRGLLGHASLMMVTSYPNRTSPVLRGKWLLEKVLGAPPPEPPADVPALPDRGKGGEVVSVRQRLEEHRKDPVCANCHRTIDPMGFALENFEAVGKWRTVDDGGVPGAKGQPVDSSGVLPDGTAFQGVTELRDLLVSRRKTEFVSTVVEQLLTYALGRGLEYYDMPSVRGIVRAAEADNYSWSSVILAIVRSTPFQMRRAS